MITLLKYWKIIVIGLLLGFSTIMTKSWYEQKYQKENAQQIIDKTVNPKLIVVKDSDSTWLAKISTIEATNENLKYLLGENKQLKEQIGGKLSKLQNLIQTEFESNGNFTTFIRDSIIYKDSVHVDHLSVFTYSDKNLTQGCQILNNQVSCQYTYQDSVTAIVYMKKMWKWYQFWKWGKRESTTEIRFSNPNTKATNVKSIIINK